ncbi:MAG TPA: hypothetical protein VMV33_01320 [Rhodocyclaceae bacterium]|nr:hypothetical protein [Rhodocyclaceae bacterium]
MHIASIGSTAPARIPTPATEVNAGHDGDGDDRTSTAAAAPTPASTVNSSGQTIGQTIDIKA